MFTCPVCFYDKLQYSPSNYNICECCGTEFENDDCYRSHDELRAQWAQNGAPWFFGAPPAGWNPWVQLTKANARVPYSISFTFSGTQGLNRFAEKIAPQRETREVENVLAYAS